MTTPTATLIDFLGYKHSSAFLQGDSLNQHPGYSYVFRRAQQDCGLQGVYTLRDQSSDSLVPLVYICDAEDETQAQQIHKKVWNQNTVPFLFVVTPRSIRLYSGFRYEKPNDLNSEQVLAKLLDVTLKTLEELSSFKADAIDQGQIWQQWGSEVTPETRVDWALLEQLKQLSEWLQNHGLDIPTAHALIGKYVYLYYLKDRGILSLRKLDKWHIEEASLFSCNAKLEAFQQVVNRLEQRLNGSVFPLPDASKINDIHIQKLASVFLGDEVSGQTHLDFQRYDFAHIPIETLSVVYEQFLHEEGRGRDKGAYYTPIHLVNFMLDELEAKRPLQPSMKVLDPACGSGAFLVQCYRRLIERQYAEQGPLRPTELCQLLTDHIFGVDKDFDACNVASFSLVLTLLDYIQPPDLETYDTFKIPSLVNSNIIEGDFFEDQAALPKQGFDWIVSNPPWKELKSKNISMGDESAFSWMKKHRNKHPVGRNQLAEAFTWKVGDYAKPDSVIALLIPAMALFKSESLKFRQQFFKRWDTWAVVNFANLARILFKDRAEIPAAVLFYSPKSEADEPREYIDTYAPFLVNQIAHHTRYGTKAKRPELWNLVINSGELRQVEYRDVLSGDSLPWKIAMWGSVRDARFLRSIAKRFQNTTLEQFAEDHNISIYEGIQLRDKSSLEEIELVEELKGKKALNMKVLRESGKIFNFPDAALGYVGSESAYVRKGRVKKPLSICRPPHIIVHAARRFAVYSNEFIVVPPRQIGIAGQAHQASLLKALALYLNSDFAEYHQFFYAAAWGIKRGQATQENLKQLPIPLDQLGADELNKWTVLYDQLVQADKAYQSAKTSGVLEKYDDKAEQRQSLLKELNTRVYALLGISTEDRYLIEDLIQHRIEFEEGKLNQKLMSWPQESEIRQYADIFRSELDQFFGDDSAYRHRVQVFFNRQQAAIEVSLETGNSTKNLIRIQEVQGDLSAQLSKLSERLKQQHSQWMYFDRHLTIFDGPRTYLFKPMQKLHWLRSQALIDADNLIAATLVQASDSFNQDRLAAAGSM